MSVEPLEVEAAPPVVALSDATSLRSTADSPAQSAAAFLLLLTASHFLVDTVACIVTPLWPDLERQFALSAGGILWIYVGWTLSTSITQLVFGYLGDRFRGRWLIWAGPAVSVVCMSSIGLVSQPWMLAVLLIVGGLGTAAFHPESAAAAGACTPAHRSRAMSIYAIGGYLGQAAGPYYSGRLTDWLGLPGLAWTMVWGLIGVLFVAIALRLIPGPAVAAAPARGRSSPGQFHGKRRAVALLLAIGVTRVMAATGVPLALAFILSGRQASNTQIGQMQSVFLIGIGAGGLICALGVRHRAERRVLWLLPLCIAPLVALLPGLEGLAQTACVAVTGLLLGIALPVMVSYGQQLLPHGQRVASSITMGVSWGLAGGIVALTMFLVQRWGGTDLAFYVFAASLVASSVLCIWLPRIESYEAGGQNKSGPHEV